MSLFDRLTEAEYALPPALAETLLSPALIVDLDRVRANVARVVARCGSVDRWRPHVKSAKIPEVFVELGRSGVRHFKCATTREADCLLSSLSRAGLSDIDVLVAYPLVGPALLRLAQVAGDHPRAQVSVLCEDEGDLARIPPSIGVFVDLNPGMNRTGMPPERWGSVIDIARRAGRRFRGLHYYDGHVTDPDGRARRDRVFQGYDALCELRASLAREGVEVGELITAGTPAFLSALDYVPFRRLRDGVHRVSPGTVVLHDARSAQDNPGFDLDPAAVLLTRVVSVPQADIVTCDAGSKSLAAEAGDPCAVVLGHPELTALTPSEEHLPLRVTGGVAPKRGDTLYLVPRHVCPTVNLAEQAVLVDGDRCEVVPVAARAHELMLSPESVAARSP